MGWKSQNIPQLTRYGGLMVTPGQREDKTPDMMLLCAIAALGKNSTGRPGKQFLPNIHISHFQLEVTKCVVLTCLSGY